MCLAIFKPAGVELPEPSIRSGWIGNPDGGGYAFVKEGSIVVRKNFGKLAEFYAAYKKDAEENAGSPFVVHFHIRSMGDRSLDNTHPFEFEHGVLIHNGTLTGTGARSLEGPSDTKLFADKFGKYLTYDNVEKYKKDFEEALDYNKIVLLYPDGRHHILNEDKGETDNKVWYSNSSYRTRTGNYHMLPSAR